MNNNVAVTGILYRQEKSGENHHLLNINCVVQGLLKGSARVAITV